MMVSDKQITFEAKLVPEVRKQKDPAMEGKEPKELELDRAYKMTLTEVTRKWQMAERLLEETRETLKTAMDRVSMLDAGLAMKTTSIDVHRTEDPDSIEIGEQKTGRMKVYGDLNDKTKFAKKVKNAFEIVAGAREQLKKLNGGQ